MERVLKIIEMMGGIPIKWLKQTLNAFESNPKTLMWIGIFGLTIITGQKGLPFLGVLFQAIKGYFK